MRPEPRGELIDVWSLVSLERVHRPLDVVGQRAMDAVLMSDARPDGAMCYVTTIELSGTRPSATPTVMNGFTLYEIGNVDFQGQF